MIKAKTRMIERDSEAAASEVFAISDNITPIAIASVNTILKLDDVEDLQVVPEQKVKQLIIENKTTNPMSKFFVRLGTYLDSMENFLSEMQSNYLKAIEQKRSLYGIESSDQKQKTARAKRAARKLVIDKTIDSIFSGRSSGSLIDNPLGLMLANFVAAGFDNRSSDQSKDVVIIPYNPVAGQLKAKGETEGSDVSGYELTSAYGYRWGRMHGGVDIGVPIGTMFALKKDAVIKYVGYQNSDDPSVGYGLLVDAWVPSLNKMFRFAHLSEVAVKIDQTVKAGQVMGKSGNTGLSTGPHFHIEVHNQVTSTYGGDDPTPYIDYVIAGDEMMKDSLGPASPGYGNDQRSEGSIERVGRVMVGEAGAEFVIPMSQMPIFAHLMMEEKIKSLNPLYNPPYGRFDNLGIERQSGFTNTMMAAGGITINNNHKIAAKRLKTYFPTAEPIHIAAAMGNFETEAPKLRPDTYQWYGGPGRGIAQWETPGRWDTAVKKYGPNVINSLENQLKFVKWEMDTAHVINGSPNLPWGYATKKEWLKTKNITSATENFMEGYESPGEPHWSQRLANAVSFLDQMPKILGSTAGRTETQLERNQRERNTMDASEFFGTNQYGLDEIPGRVNLQSSNRLNSIPGNEQMQVANETQEQFSLGDAKGGIVALYQPTVYYTES